MKASKIFAWIFGILGVLFMIAGCINYLAPDWLFHVAGTVSYFHVASSLLLLTIVLLLCQLTHKE
jgi:hypothetical protein